MEKQYGKSWINPKHDSEAYDAVAREAEDIAESLTQNTLHRLRAINRDLSDLGTAIRDLQPKRHGALLMERYTCGKGGTVGCLGCPHIRWKQWADPAKATGGHRKEGWRAHPVEAPLKRIRRTGEFAEHWQAVAALIHEAIRLLKEKDKIIKHLSNLSRSLSVSLRKDQGG